MDLVLNQLFSLYAGGQLIIVFSTKKTTFMKRDRLLRETKSPCQEHSRDEHPILSKTKSPKGSDPTFK